jgi:hypothetical protein
MLANPAKVVLYAQTNGISKNGTLQINDPMGRKLKKEKVMLNENHHS